MFKIVKVQSPPNLAMTHKAFYKLVKGKSVKEGYRTYKQNNRKYFYNTDETKNAFELVNYSRCSFCSKFISDFQFEMTVEHIELKSKCPSKIFNWKNMLCACRTCNTKRSVKAYYQDLYLDPRINDKIESYFEYSIDGTINVNKKLDKREIDRANYMIKLYSLDRPSLVYERKQFFEDLLDDDIRAFVLKCDNNCYHIRFLSVINYVKVRNMFNG